MIFDFNKLLSEDENECMNLSAEFFNKFKSLPVIHPSDLDEFIHHLHVLQNIILSRAAYRNLKNK